MAFPDNHRPLYDNNQEVQVRKSGLEWYGTVISSFRSGSGGGWLYFVRPSDKPKSETCVAEAELFPLNRAGKVRERRSPDPQIGDRVRGRFNLSDIGLVEAVLAQEAGKEKSGPKYVLRLDAGGTQTYYAHELELVHDLEPEMARNRKSRHKHRQGDLDFDTPRGTRFMNGDTRGTASTSQTSEAPWYPTGTHEWEQFDRGLHSPGRGASRVQFVRAPSQPPPFEFHATGLKRLWAGRNPLSGNDVRKLLGLGITHILDLREEQEWAPPRKGADALALLEKKNVVRLNLPIVDTTPPSMEQLNLAFAFLQDALANEQTRAYVHCRAGKGRTGAILLAYAAGISGEPVGKCAHRLHQAYKLFSPLPGQEDAVRHWAAQRLGQAMVPAGTAPVEPEHGGLLMACDTCSRVYEVAPQVNMFVCGGCVEKLTRKKGS